LIRAGAAAAIPAIVSRRKCAHRISSCDGSELCAGKSKLAMSTNEIVADLGKYVEAVKERNLQESLTILTMVETLSTELMKIQNELLLKANTIEDLTQQKKAEQLEYEQNLTQQQEIADEKYQQLLSEYEQEKALREQDLQTIELMKQDQNTLLEKLNQQEILSTEKFITLQNQFDELQVTTATAMTDKEKQITETQQKILVLEKDIKQLKRGQVEAAEANERERIKANEKISRLIQENEECTLQLSQCRITEHDNVISHQLLDEMKPQCDELRRLNKEKDEAIERLTQEVLAAKMESVKYYNDYDVELKKVAQLTRALSATKMMSENEDESVHRQTTTGNAGIGATSAGSHGLGIGGMKFNLRAVADKMTHLGKEHPPNGDHEERNNRK
jgi:DNA repair exonuclease SbcCD ATPase subunit